MSGTLNKAILIGQVGREPQIETREFGRVATFSLATDEHWKDKITGEKKKKTEWHRIVCYNEGLIRVIQAYVKKGTSLCVEGQINTREWIGDDKDQKRYITEIVLRNFNSNLYLLSRADDTRRDENNEDSNYAEIPF